MQKLQAKIKIVLFFSFMLLLLVGVAFFLLRGRTIVMPTQPASAPEFDVALTVGSSIGQTFVSRYSQFMGVELELERQASATSGFLVATLLPSPEASQSIAQLHIPVADLPQAGRYSIRFAPLADSRDSSYFLSLEMSEMPAEAVIVFRGHQPLSYLHGTFYGAGEPQDQQLLFNLVLRSNGLLLDLLAFARSTLIIAFLCLLLFFLPGYTLLLWITPTLTRDWRLGLLISPAISLSLFPLLYLWLHIFDIPINRFLLVGLGLILILLCLWGWQRSREKLEEPKSRDIWADVALFCLVLFVIFARLWPIHVLEGPSWGDSVQHTVMAQLFVDNEGLFDTWLPYAPYQSLTTHFGFSAAVALYAMLSGTPVIASTLLMGQLLNILAVLCLYPLALYATGNRWAGVGTVLFAGLLSPMPSEYVNWGRYAQLSGQVVLPAAILLFWHLLQQGLLPAKRLRDGLPLALLTAVVLAGMALCYYRAPIVFMLFFIGWGLLYALPAWRTSLQRWRLRLTQVILVAVVGTGLLAPWVANLRNSKLQQGVMKGLSSHPPLEKVMDEYRGLWEQLDTYVPNTLLILCGLTLLLALFRRRRWVWLLALWTFFLIGIQATQLLNLPLANYLQTFATMIMLYIPVGLLLGWFVGRAASLSVQPAFRFLLCSMVIGLGFFGMTEQVRVIKSDYIMLTQPDLQAMAWIDQNLPQETNFLVNGFTIYNDSSAVGADGGWWLPLLTKRSNSMPPQYPMLNEQPITSGYTKQVVDLVIALREQPLDSPERVQRLCQEGITHIYSGQGQGLVGAGVMQLFNPTLLEANSALIKIYHRDQVRIFELSPEICAVQ